MEEAGLRQRLRAIGLQDQVAELLFLAGERLLLLLAGEPAGDVQVDLALVAAEVQDFERAERFVNGLPLALDLNEPLARGVNGELAEIGDDPLAAQLLGHGGRRAAAAEEIGDEVTLVAAGTDNSLEQGLWLLGRISPPIRRSTSAEVGSLCPTKHLTQAFPPSHRGIV